MVWAEVIGDPIAHSRSPAIHGFWLDVLDIEGDYRATRVPRGRLGSFLSWRRADAAWRGCNVTAPHKLAVIPFLDRLSEVAKRIGAVNCILSEGGTLTGLNTDLCGIREALADTDIADRKVAVIGAGGAARAALAYLCDAGVGEIALLARNPDQAAPLLHGAKSGRALPFAGSAEAMAGASLIINASTLGMAPENPMPEDLLRVLASAAPGATAFDMVYEPLDTRFLQLARLHGLQTVDGLKMLVGQAREAFHLFFDARPPREQDEMLSAILIPA